MKKEESLKTKSLFAHDAYVHLIAQILNDAKSKFDVQIDKGKLVHVYNPNRISVLVAPIMEKAEAENEWRNIAIAIIEPAPSNRKIHLPLGVYLFQANGKRSRFIDGSGNTHLEGVNKPIAKTTNIDIGFVTVSISSDSVCIGWDSPDSCQQRCVRS